MLESEAIDRRFAAQSVSAMAAMALPSLPSASNKPNRWTRAQTLGTFLKGFSWSCSDLFDLKLVLFECVVHVLSRPYTRAEAVGGLTSFPPLSRMRSCESAAETAWQGP